MKLIEGLWQAYVTSFPTKPEEMERSKHAFYCGFTVMVKTLDTIYEFPDHIYILMVDQIKEEMDEFRKEHMNVRSID